MKHPDYPGVSSMITRHGKTRWRLRRSGHKDVMLPGEPHTEEFDETFERAITGQAAPVIPMPGATNPKSLKAAYRILKGTDKWRALDDKSHAIYQPIIERILSIPSGNSVLGNGPAEELRRPHVKAILSHFEESPHVQKLALLCMRKLILVAMDEEWIEVDPTYKMTCSPHTDGHRAWTPTQMAKYEKRWAIGTPQRTAYALALWLGNRISDVARLKWSDFTTKHIMDGETLRSVDGFEFIQFKGRKRGKKIFLPMTPMLEKELATLTRNDGPVLVSSRKKAYADASLTACMARWCSEAGIESGYTMHGLRKALGVKLAEADASTRQLMETLGHSSIALAELYSREASQVRLAVQAMDKVVRLEAMRK